MFDGCVNNISKAKKKVSTITSVGFKTLKEYVEKWTAVEKGPFSFFISFLTNAIQLKLNH